jgi:L-lactate dehydrogenase complex protein LldG
MSMTNSARADILGNIRRSLGVTGKERPRNSAVEERIARVPAGPIPARAQLDPAGQVALFCEEAERVSATIVELASAAEVPGEVARYLREANLPATIRIGTDPRLAGLPWAETALEVGHGPSDGNDLNSVSHAFAAVAETGTLVLPSGPDNPTTLNFLPDNHVVVLNARDVVGDLESVWSRLRERYGRAAMPRALNLVTGPSRSGDIEQTMLLGAHGPRRLHILLVRD